MGQTQLLPHFGAQSYHFGVIPEKQQLLFGNRVAGGLSAQDKYRKGVCNVLVEIVCPIAADIVGRIFLIVAHCGIAEVFPEAVVKCFTEGALYETSRIVCIFTDGKIDLGIILEQGVPVFMSNNK